MMVSKLHKLLEITPEADPQKPDFWFHLGQTHAWWWWYLRVQARIDRQKQNDHETQAIAQAREAIRAYGAATAYKGYDRKDAVLYYLARLHIGVGDWNQARGYLYRLATEHPRSRYVPQVTALYADYLFERGDLAAALDGYRKAATFTDSFMLPYALYRKGWCLLKQGDAVGGLAALLAASQAEPTPPIQWPYHARQVRAVAARDVARIQREQQ
jgi:outer membrane protein assembly factor BamD (BamD/ComL family)